MKRIEITVPAEDRETVEEVIEKYDEPAASEIEKDDRSFIKFECSLDSEDIDTLTEELKDIKDLETGELTINILDETAMIEKGIKRRGGTSSLSVQEMYTKAFSFATFTNSSWALILLSTGIAVFGAVTENVMVVIGAMVIAPMLGPFMSASFGLVIGDRRIIQDSVYYGLLSIVVAIGFAAILGFVIPSRPNSLIRLIAYPGFATIPLSLCVGAAAALTFATEARESLAGVAVAIALVPPAAVAGLAISMTNWDLLFRVLLVIMSNVSALILAGSVTFKLFGITPSTYYRKKVSEEQLRRALYVSGFVLLLITITVVFISYQDLQNSYEQTAIQKELEQQFGDRLISHTIDATPNSIDVHAVVAGPEITEQQLQQELDRLSRREVTVRLIGIQQTGE